MPFTGSLRASTSGFHTSGHIILQIRKSGCVRNGQESCAMHTPVTFLGASLGSCEYTEENL